jgi:hypothetical protein
VGPYSIREILLWIGGMVVAATIIILAVIYVTDNFLIPRDPTDPLTIRGGLKPGGNQKK